MAEYVADSFEEHLAPLSGTYTTDEADKTLTLGSDGEADTSFTLPPSSAWLMVEVYDVEDVSGDIGYTRYTDNVTNVTATMAAVRTIAISEYTNFKITATHYNGDDTADLYTGDESTALSLSSEGAEFTPPTVSWKLSNNLLSPIDDADLTEALVAHFLLNNNADDSVGTYDGTEVGTVDFTGDYLDPLSGSVTIPSTGGSWCCYWKDTGSGFAFTSSATVPTSLATDDYSNLRVYSSERTGTVLTALQNEGYYAPRESLTAPRTTNLIAHYPLMGTGRDTTGNNDATEVGATYTNDGEFGTVLLGDGTNNNRYVVTPTTVLNSMGSSDFAISTWVYMTALDVISINMHSRSNTIDEVGIYQTADSKMRFVIGDADSGGIRNVTIDSTYTNRWVHVIMNNNGTTNIADVYLDLVDKGEIADTSGYSGGSYPLYIGDAEPSGDYPMTGRQRDIRFYSDLLTEADRLDIHNFEKNFRPIDITDGLIAFYSLTENALDESYNEYDATADAGVTYDSSGADIPNGDNITFPAATGFVEAYYTIDGVVTKTTTESALNSLTDCVLKDVRKYNSALSADQQAVIGYSA